jgi:C_GCAxxG_C_C family probable redox protein
MISLSETSMKRKEQALKDLKNGFCCAQAVATAFSVDFGISRKTAAKMASPFGAGMSRTGSVCGAVTGALLAIGMKHGGSAPSETAAKKKGYAVSKGFLNKFVEKYGSTLCPKLIGIDITTDEGMEAARAKGIFDSVCASIVTDTIGMLEDIGIADKK